MHSSKCYTKRSIFLERVDQERSRLPWVTLALDWVNTTINGMLTNNKTTNVSNKVRLRYRQRSCSQELIPTGFDSASTPIFTKSIEVHCTYVKTIRKERPIDWRCKSLHGQMCRHRHVGVWCMAHPRGIDLLIGNYYWRQFRVQAGALPLPPLVQRMFPWFPLQGVNCEWKSIASIDTTEQSISLTCWLALSPAVICSKFHIERPTLGNPILIINIDWSINIVSLWNPSVIGCQPTTFFKYMRFKKGLLQQTLVLLFTCSRGAQRPLILSGCMGKWINRLNSSTF